MMVNSCPDPLTVTEQYWLALSINSTCGHRYRFDVFGI